MNIRRAALACCASAVAITSWAAPVATVASSTPVRALDVAARSGRLFGTYLDGHGMASPAYRDRLKEFSLIEAWSSWTELEPCHVCWHWGHLDQELTKIKNAGGASAKSTALVWGHDAPPGKPGNFTPGYLSQMSAAQLRAELKHHIQTIIHRYPQVKVWTIANEPFANPDAHLQVKLYVNVFDRKLGAGWIREALIDAYAANPKATYIAINELDADGVNYKSTALYNYYRLLVGTIPSSHLAVGLQMHLDSCPGAFLNPNVWQVAQNMQRFDQLGVRVHVTEMDYGIRCVPGTFAQKLAAQREKFHAIARFCLAVRNCTAFSVWGVGDADTWRRWELHDHDWPLLFDDRYKPKPAYYGVLDALNGR